MLAPRTVNVTDCLIDLCRAGMAMVPLADLFNHKAALVQLTNDYSVEGAYCEGQPDSDEEEQSDSDADQAEDAEADQQSQVGLIYCVRPHGVKYTLAVCMVTGCLLQQEACWSKLRLTHKHPSGCNAVAWQAHAGRANNLLIRSLLPCTA